MRPFSTTRQPVRYAGAFVALAVLAGCLLLSLARVLGSEVQLLALTASFAPWAVLGYALALVTLLCLQRRATTTTARRVLTTGVVLSLAGLALHAAWLAPSFAGRAGTGDPDLVVIGFNLQLGSADLEATVRMVEREDPDVVVLSEATPEAVRALASRGIGGPDSALPHQAGRAVSGARGTVVLSAYALSRERQLDVGSGAHQMWVAAPTPFWLTAVHTTMPLISNAGWRHDFEVLRAATTAVRGPQVLVGDFNATLDHGVMRDLLDTGLHSAAVEANAGWQPTWPTAGERSVAGGRVPWRLLTIDHVLLSEEVAAVSTSVHTVPGSDHQALVARLLLAPG